MCRYIIPHSPRKRCGDKMLARMGSALYIQEPDDQWTKGDHAAQTSCGCFFIHLVLDDFSVM